MKAGPFGCRHYSRGCAFIAPCCQEQHTCRHCHDEVSDHPLGKNIPTELVCLRCDTGQNIVEVCHKCNLRFGTFSCLKCCVFSATPIFHCSDCGVCRFLDSDFVHCATCKCCVERGSHKCLDNSLRSDCPICAENLFFSTKETALMACGHAMHAECLKMYGKRSIQCPVCYKTCVDTREYDCKVLMILDRENALNQRMDGFQVELRCYDCMKVGLQAYNFLFNRCSACQSFNTTHGEMYGITLLGIVIATGEELSFQEKLSFWKSVDQQDQNPSKNFPRGIPTKSVHQREPASELNHQIQQAQAGGNQIQSKKPNGISQNKIEEERCGFNTSETPSAESLSASYTSLSEKGAGNILTGRNQVQQILSHGRWGHAVTNRSQFGNIFRSLEEQIEDNPTLDGTQGNKSITIKTDSTQSGHSSADNTNQPLIEGQEFDLETLRRSYPGSMHLFERLTGTGTLGRMDSNTSGEDISITRDIADPSTNEILSSQYKDSYKDASSQSGSSSDIVCSSKHTPEQVTGHTGESPKTRASLDILSLG